VSLKSWLAAALLCAALAAPAHADIVSEFGMGVKMPSTSYLLVPSCDQAIVIQPEWPENPRGLSDPYSCGGDNPAFVGWPIAYEREFLNGALRFRGGWFHYSNWFDGGRSFETHADIAAASVTVNWSQIKRNRKLKG
jgi:hypothetical protein